MVLNPFFGQCYGVRTVDIPVNIRTMANDPKASLSDVQTFRECKHSFVDAMKITHTHERSSQEAAKWRSKYYTAIHLDREIMLRMLDDLDEMLHNRRLRQYQKFLKALKHRESKLCSCPLHLHPRPWIPPPCRTSKPSVKMERRHFRWETDDDEDQLSQSTVHCLYNDARILKRGGRKEKQTGSDHSKHPRGADGKAVTEEEALQQGLRNLQELTQSNAVLTEENKSLMRKVRHLQQHIKRQEAAQKETQESIGTEEGIANREEYVILSLQKKYEDLLQYVIKVESENQKLKSLIGASVGPEVYSNGSEQDDAEHGRRVVARLQNELKALREKVQEKNKYIQDCEQHLQSLRENIALHESMRNQNSDAQGINTATVEEEWMRRLNEMREMYERAIQGFKDQLRELHEKLLDSEEVHAKQVQKLKERLAIAQTVVRSKKINGGDVSEPPGAIKVYDGQEKHSDDGEIINESGRTSKQREEKLASVSSSEESESQKGAARSERDGDKVSVDKTAKNSIGDEKINQTEEPSQTQITREINEKDEDTNSRLPAIIAGDEKYSKMLEYLVKKLETLCLGGSEMETTLSVITDTINRCLQEWRERFPQEQAKQKDEGDEIKKDYEDLQKKLRGKNKKIEGLQKQCNDLEQQNMTLLHQCSQLGSKMAASQVIDQLDVLQGFPQKLQETEQKLLDTKELLQKAEGEKQTLQDQVQLLGEKLSKKENKLKAEREENVGREKEIASFKEATSSLQHQLEEVSRKVIHMQEQLSTKDAILEHTSAQLEERIRECASLSSLVERYKIQQNQESDHIQAQSHEKDTTSHKHYVEAQALASRYHAQLSTLYSEKDRNEKTLRNHIRKLEEQVDQLQLRNSTLQRQLTSITSTYHTMFSAVELNLPGSSGLESSVMKGQ
ncbi:uncharacterized protein [Panulirus ornatus]|uniref:uncharacterized protein isoform X2 n=1 Tax=Panulirus ornatus TaxID=150431 RepID=UPI003A869BB3